MPHKYLDLQCQYIDKYAKLHHINMYEQSITVEDALDDIHAPRDVYPFYLDIDALNECANSVLSNKPYITYTTNKSKTSDSIYLNMQFKNQKYTLRIATHKHPIHKNLPYLHWNEGLTIGDTKTNILIGIKRMCLKYMEENIQMEVK